MYPDFFETMPRSIKLYAISITESLMGLYSMLRMRLDFSLLKMTRLLSRVSDALASTLTNDQSQTQTYGATKNGM